MVLCWIVWFVNLSGPENLVQTTTGVVQTLLLISKAIRHLKGLFDTTLHQLSFQTHYCTLLYTFIYIERWSCHNFTCMFSNGFTPSRVLKENPCTVKILFGVKAFSSVKMFIEIKKKYSKLKVRKLGLVLKIILWCFMKSPFYFC